MPRVKTVIGVKMMYFVHGRVRRVTLYQETRHNCDGVSDETMVDLLNEIRRENSHIEPRDIWVESTTIRTLV